MASHEQTVETGAGAIESGKRLSLDAFLKSFDRADLQEHVRAAEERRAQLLKLFPLDEWPKMPLEKYALGHEDSKGSFCRWMEFDSQELGSMRGGSAQKLIIFKFRDQPEWYFPRVFQDERSAWEHLRQDFVRAFEFAAQQRWEEIDSLETLGRGSAIKLKTLHLYFPQDVLAAYSLHHFRHYLRRLEDPQAGSVSYSATLQANRALLAALRRHHALQDWSTNELGALLYRWADPRETRRVFKIAPGENAKFWRECLENKYICVGWDKVGDLRELESKDALRERMEQEYGEFYKGHQPTITKKTKEVWTLHELEPGDLIVANQGTSKVLAIGTVVEPGYEFREDRPEFKHTVSVNWDPSYATDIAPQKNWAMLTVAKVPDTVYQKIVSGRVDAGSRPKPPVDPLFERIATSLQRKGQVILYGPPGTGKTYIARRFSVWWLLRSAGNEDDAAFSDAARFAAEERRLSTSQIERRTWWMVANPQVWSWEQLFREGKVSYDRGRLVRNFSLVQQGDLVVGYQSTPDKRIVALARISKELRDAGSDQPSIELEPVVRVKNGPTYDELLGDRILSSAEPMRFRNQGTLFALTRTEADYLLARLGEENAEVARLIDEMTSESAVGPLTRVTFHPSYAYEDFIEGFRPSETGKEGLSLELVDGVFKRVCRTARAHPEQPFLILIDEINRGNVAKILGELLTLLERDKRGLSVTLPQSKESFSIPPNVYLLGTMNTADRSIKLMDAALRRRFAFIEMMPDVDLLSQSRIGELALDDFLRELNSRIARSEGREKQIGHAYLLHDGEPISDAEEFSQRFREEILPLLQEYCYDEYPTLARYIGSGLVDSEAQTLRHDRLSDPDTLIAELAKEFTGNEESAG